MTSKAEVVHILFSLTKVKAEHQIGLHTTRNFSPRRGCPRVLKFCMGFLDKIWGEKKIWGQKLMWVKYF